MVSNIIILAGGSGTRLWPASNSKNPKQFLAVDGPESLLQKTLQRALALKPDGKILIVTHKDHMQAAIEHAIPVSTEEDKTIILPEPEGKNTAPALAYAAAFLGSQGREKETCLVLPADHLISPVDVFARDVEKADRIAQDGHLVTFGIPPSRPETGYGYIEGGSPYGKGRLIKSFKEKPDYTTAKLYVERGNYFWNSGMFVFRSDSYVTELKKHASDVSGPFERLFDTCGKGENTISKGEKNEQQGIPHPYFEITTEQKVSVVSIHAALEEAYRKVPSISIDFAVMEKARVSAMVRSEFSWNDVGSWDVVADISEGPGTELFEVDASGNFVYGDSPVALCGVNDLIVVVHNGTVLICKKGETQKVRDIVRMLKDQDRSDLL